MFGNLAAFVNGNLFAGLFGEDLFVRLSRPDEQTLLQVKGSAPFAPMKGRTMKGYVVIPKTWKNDQTIIKSWLRKSLDFVSTLPPKSKKLSR
jgi:TfoX/Sxy family transcriptional regulator of competence genes